MDKLDQYVEEQRLALQAAGCFKEEDISVMLAMFRAGYRHGQYDDAQERSDRLDREHRVITNK